MTYIALLRGINVGGHTVKMEYMRQLFAELGLANVRSYIQSGNIFFDTDASNDNALVAKIEEHLQQALGYAVPVFLRTVSELEQIVALDPFKDVPHTPDVRFCILFTAKPIQPGLLLPMYSPKKDMQIVRVTEREAFVVWYIVNGRPPASQSFLATTLDSNGTTRFFHTTLKILAAAKK